MPLAKNPKRLRHRAHLRKALSVAASNLDSRIPQPQSRPIVNNRAVLFVGFATGLVSGACLLFFLQLVLGMFL
jgi:hypothetical protein